MRISKYQKKVRQSGNKGFTLIEVLIVIVILSIGLLGMASLTVGVIKGNSHSKHSTTATVLAQEKIEDIKKLGYSGTASSDTTTTEDYGSISGFSLFKRDTVVDVDSPAANMKTVTATVYWDSDNKSMNIQTILAE